MAWSSNGGLAVASLNDASKSLWKYEEDAAGRPGFIVKTTPGAPFDADAATAFEPYGAYDTSGTGRGRVEGSRVSDRSERAAASMVLSRSAHSGWP